MNDDEKREAMQMLARIELSANDGADIYEFANFARAMEEKYGLPFEQMLKD